MKNTLVIVIPMLPPSVNHYVEHRAMGVHVKSAAARAWEREWPLFAQQRYVVGSRFSVHLRFRFGPRDRYDWDNLPKCVMDAIAKSGMLRDGKGKNLSDACVKRAVVDIEDSPEDRKLGPQTHITIEAME